MHALTVQHQLQRRVHGSVRHQLLLRRTVPRSLASDPMQLPVQQRRHHPRQIGVTEAGRADVGAAVNRGMKKAGRQADRRRLGHRQRAHLRDQATIRRHGDTHIRPEDRLGMPARRCGGWAALCLPGAGPRRVGRRCRHQDIRPHGVGDPERPILGVAVLGHSTLLRHRAATLLGSSRTRLEV